MYLQPDKYITIYMCMHVYKSFETRLRRKDAQKNKEKGFGEELKITSC